MLRIKTAIIVIAALLVIVFLEQCQVRGALADSQEGLVISSSPVKGVDRSVLFGIDFKAHGYDELYQYAGYNSHNIYVLGSTSNGDVQLTSYNVKDRKGVSVVRYGSEYVWAMRTAKFKLFFVQKSNQKFPWVLMEFGWGNISRYVDEQTTVVEVYSTKDGERYRRICSKEVSENSWAKKRNDEKEKKFLYLAVDHSTTGPGHVAPATKEISQIFLTDIDADGYTDIAVWKRVCLSRMIDEKEKDDFVLSYEELFALYFQNDQKGFSPLKSVGWE